MIDFDRARHLVLAADRTDSGVSDYVEAASEPAPGADRPGRLTAEEARAIYAYRGSGAKKAGVDVRGTDATLARLSAREPHETVLVFPFATESRAYLVFIMEQDASFAGCISVPRRQPDPNSDWSSGFPEPRT